MKMGQVEGGLVGEKRKLEKEKGREGKEETVTELSENTAIQY